MIKIILLFKIKKIIKLIQKEIIHINFEPDGGYPLLYKIDTKKFEYVRSSFNSYEIFLKKQNILIISLSLINGCYGDFWVHALNDNISLNATSCVLKEIINDLRVCSEVKKEKDNKTKKLMDDLFLRKYTI